MDRERGSEPGHRERMTRAAIGGARTHLAGTFGGRFVVRGSTISGLGEHRRSLGQVSITTHHRS